MKNRSASCVVYPESCPDLISAINHLEPMRYAYILHDCDTDEFGELKKSHYHVYLYFENARQFSSIANAFCIAENNIEPVKNLRSLIRYFSHIDYPDKWQYNFQDIVSFNLDIEKHYADVSESARINQMLDLIEDCLSKGMPTIDIMRECANKGFYADLRRSGWLGHQIIEESRKKAVNCIERLETSSMQF